MSRVPHLSAMLLTLTVLFAAPAAFSQLDEYQAFGKPAVDVTGDIVTSDGHIQFKNGARMLFDLIGNRFVVGEKQIPASVYRITGNGDPALLNGSRLCASGAVTYVIFWKSSPDLSAMGIFSGAEPPKNSAEACADYSYKNLGPLSVPTGGGG